MSNDPINPFASPQASLDVRPEVAWATEQPAALRKVKLGLTLVYSGICGLLLAGLSMLGLLVSSASTGMEDHGLMLAMLGGAMLVLSLMIFAGEMLCIAVPQESKAKTLAIAAVALQALSFTTSLLVAIFPNGTAFLIIVGNVFGVASLACFTLFMRRVAIFIDRQDIAGRATRALFVSFICVMLIVVGAVAPRMGLLGGESFLPFVTVSTTLGVIGAIGSLIALIMYANTVTYLRKAITV